MAISKRMDIFYMAQNGSIKKCKLWTRNTLSFLVSDWSIILSLIYYSDLLLIPIQFFSFTTSKGLGYSCYFMGNCLVLRCTKTIGKDLTKCIRHELTPRKWLSAFVYWKLIYDKTSFRHHVAISFGPLRWGKVAIKFIYNWYQIVTNIERSPMFCGR